MAGSPVRRVLAGEVCTPRESLGRHMIHIAEGRIANLEPDPQHSGDAGVLDAADAIVIPGLVDLQVNGALGWSFQSSHRDHYDEILDFHLKHGTTTLAPTLITAEQSMLVDSLRSVVTYMNSDTAVTLPGIHLEGPFLSREKSGAHDTDALRLPDLSLAKELHEAAQGQLKIVTLAPELPGSSDLIAFFSEHNVLVAAGHSAAKFEHMQQAIKAGLSFVTHAGNATDWPHRSMGNLGFMSSEPGVVGTLLASSELGASIILDGYHFHPSLVLPLLRLKGADNLVLISDASTVAGCEPGDYESGGLIVTVHPEGFATSGRGGGWLAGSIVTLLQTVQVAVKQAHVEFQDAVWMASLAPARRLKIDDHKGQIKIGADADLLILNRDLSLRHVIKGGLLQ